MILTQRPPLLSSTFQSIPTEQRRKEETPSLRPQAVQLVRIVLALRDSERIHKNCFRGKKVYSHNGRYVNSVCRYNWLPVRKAGNFSLWPDYFEMERDGFIYEMVRPWVEKEIELYPFKRQICTTLDAGETIGWASSVPLCKLDTSIQLTLDRRTINTDRKVTADYVTDLYCRAPTTSLVSINAFIKPDDSGFGWHCCIHNLYPGPGLGSFEWKRNDPGQNNVTLRTGLALFDWCHPGA